MEQKRDAAIVTFFKSYNFGSNIQAIGLFKTIEKMGYNAYMLDSFKVKSYLLRHPRLGWTRVINKLNDRKRRAFFFPETYKITEERDQRMKAFREKHFRIRTYPTGREWKEAVQKNTIYIAGSDIIWNPARGYPSTMFLDFAYYAKLPRFSYGSSVGATSLPREYYSAYRKYLGSMVDIGVREQAVADMLGPIVNRKITKVVDPSMLLTAQEWDALAEEAELSVSVQEKGFVLCYFVMSDPRYWEYVKKIAETTGLQIIVLPMNHQAEEQPYDIVMDGTPCEFIWLIKNAKFVCTDSFHACVVSMLFHKDFYLLRRTRKAEDDKYTDLLTRYRLTGRTVEDEKAFVIKPETDYSFMEQQLEKDREASLHYLRNTFIACGQIRQK